MRREKERLGRNEWRGKVTGRDLGLEGAVALSMFLL